MSALVLMLLLQTPTIQPGPACGYTATGTVECSKAAFQTLINKTLDARAEAEKCQLREGICATRNKQLEEKLLMTPAPVPVEPQRVQAKSVVVLTMAIVGTAAATTAAFNAEMTTSARVIMGSVGAAAVVGSVILTF